MVREGEKREEERKRYVDFLSTDLLCRWPLLWVLGQAGVRNSFWVSHMGGKDLVLEPSASVSQSTH